MKDKNKEKKMKKKTYTMNFKANVKLGKGLDPVSIDFSLSTDNKDKELSLTWDEVFDKAVEEAEKKYSNEDFPKMDIENLFIVMENGIFPIVAEDADMKKVKEQTLVLPYARYSLTPEYKMFIELTEKGLIHGEFDAEAMRKIIDVVNEDKK